MAKIKHWQGYGSVSVKKLAEYNTTGHSRKKTILQVTGNHEYGLVREDPYDVFNWLKKYIPECGQYRDIQDLNVYEGATTDPKTGLETDQAIYEIEYFCY